VFYDAGSVSKNQPLPTEDTVNLSSFGLGLRLNQGKDFAAKFDIGWRQKAAGTREAHKASANLSLTYSF
jgi:hemolysin activation/secretion protein